MRARVRTARYTMKWIETSEEKEKNTHSCREFYFSFWKTKQAKMWATHTADLKKIELYIRQWECRILNMCTFICVCVCTANEWSQSYILKCMCADSVLRAALVASHTHIHRHAEIMRAALTIYLICNLQFRADKYIYYWKRPHHIYEMNQGNEYKYRFIL